MSIQNLTGVEPLIHSWSRKASKLISPLFYKAVKTSQTQTRIHNCTHQIRIATNRKWIPRVAHVVTRPCCHSPMLSLAHVVTRRCCHSSVLSLVGVVTRRCRTPTHRKVSDSIATTSVAVTLPLIRVHIWSQFPTCWTLWERK